jgi:hypothetical protein
MEGILDLLGKIALFCVWIRVSIEFMLKVSG